MASSNGSTITPKSAVNIMLVIAIIGACITCTAFVWSQIGTSQAHCANADIHHNTTSLNADYAQKIVVDAKFEEVLRRLDRIETKLDRLQ